MMNTRKTSIILASAILVGASFAFAENDSALVEKQKSFLEKLDSLNEAVLGLRLKGTAKAGASTSIAKSDQFSKESPTQENQAYTDVNLIFTAQPSSETRATVKARLHKDWQSAVEENNNPVIGHWFSYDGLILDKHVDFNLGYMRVGYTPLTINTPQVEILQEPEIFAQNRVEALDYRNLDTTSRRLMQGLNFAYHSKKVGIFDDIYGQATGARMRNTAKKNDQVFFDFDWSDRYAYGLRGGASAFGANLGVNFVNIFDRETSTRSRDMDVNDTIVYDDNSVLSFEGAFDSKKGGLSLPITFGLNGEFAMSWWKASRDVLSKEVTYKREIVKDVYPDGEGTMDSVIYVRSKAVVNNSGERVNEEFADDNGTAFNVGAFVQGNFSKLDAKLSGMYLANDDKFWSDLASSPSYTNNGIIFNSNALYSNVDETLVSNFASGNLENLYFSIYNADLLTAATLMSSGTATVRSGSSESANLYYRLYNNFKLAHFYRNGYDANSMKKLEADEALLLMDPSVNMALPYGLATPDRKGFNASLDMKWDDAITLNARFSQYTWDGASDKFTTIGAGLGVEVGRLVPSLERKILVQGSFEKASEDAYLKRSSQRIVAGITADVWGPFAIQAGYQMLTKKFEADLYGRGVAGLPVGSSFVQQVDESLLLVGPRIRIAPASYITVRYGLLTNGVDYMSLNADATAYEKKELSIDKSIITGEVTVNF